MLPGTAWCADSSQLNSTRPHCRSKRVTRYFLVPTESNFQFNFANYFSAKQLAAVPHSVHCCGRAGRARGSSMIISRQHKLLLRPAGQQALLPLALSNYLVFQRHGYLVRPSNGGGNRRYVGAVSLVIDSSGCVYLYARHNGEQMKKW